ncbi:MAG: cyclic lactone autoinducer peptide [Firmicutes bacterium]|nr:cyclic lactone autoinducer peptide [Bacillota bacterium]
MKNLFASIFAALGFGAANIGSEACMTWFVDEEEMPKSLIK